MSDDDKPVACPDCNGSGMCPEFGECLLCAGCGTVHPGLRSRCLRVLESMRLRVIEEERGDR